MFDFGQIIESVFTFFKKGFRTFFLTLFRPRYLYGKILKNDYQEILKDYVYFIIVFSVFNIFANIHSAYYLAEFTFINYCKTFLDSLFNADLQSKVLLNLPLMIGVYVFFYLFSLLLTKNRSAVFKICLYLSASYLIISSTLADFLDVLYIYLFPKPMIDYQGRTIDAFERLGWVYLGIGIFGFFLISYLISKKSRPDFKLNCAFLLLIWASLFLNKSLIAGIQNILVRENLFSQFALFSEKGRRNEIDIQTTRIKDSSFSVSATILFKNNMDIDLVLFKDKTITICDTENQSQLNGPEPELALSASDGKNAEKFILAKKKEFAELFLVDTISEGRLIILKKRAEQGYVFKANIPYLFELSDSPRHFKPTTKLKIITNYP